MRDFFDEHRLLVISGVMMVAFFGFAFSQQSTDTSSAADQTGSFRNIDTKSPMYRGSADATASIIQYSDFLCPSCSVFSTQVMPSITKDYIETNKANFEFRPMAFIADGSMQAGMGGYCAVDQDKFWPYHDGIYEYVAAEIFNNNKNPQTDTILTATKVKEIAKSSGLESGAFDTCLDSQEHRDEVTESTNTANSNGVTGTPYIMVDGEVYQGNMSESAFEALLKAKL